MYQLAKATSTALTYVLDGQTMLVSFHELDTSTKETVRFAIIHSIAIGVGSMLMLFSWIIVINKKTPIFVLNQCSLLLLVVRSGLYLGYLLGPISLFSYLYAGDPDGVWNAYYLTVGTNIVYSLLIASVEASMVFQVYVIFKSTNKKHWGGLLTALCGLLGVVVVVFNIISSINATKIMREHLNNVEFSSYGSWVTNLPIIFFSATVNLLSTILLFKLVAAIRTRRVLGLKQFDGFHILVITMSQTLIIPSALVVANYSHISTNLLSSLSFILTVCNLPFGSLWAISSNHNVQPTSAPNTVLNRCASHASSEGTYAVKDDVSLRKNYSVDFEKGPQTASTSPDNDQDSVDRILDGLEDRGFDFLVTNTFTTKLVT